MNIEQLKAKLGNVTDVTKLYDLASLAWESGDPEMIELVNARGKEIGIALPKPLTAKKEEKEITAVFEKAKENKEKFGGERNRDGQPRRRLKKL